MKKIFLLALVSWMFAITIAEAQKDEYTYLNDKKFKDAEAFFGYNFVPSIMEIPEPGQTKPGEQVDISAGSYKFGITRGNLFVKGEDIDGIHNINQINSTDYGYQLVLMNARDPKQQGHLKIIMYKTFVDALVFKANNDAPEMVFLLPEIEEGLNETEKNYFTDKNEIFVEYAEEIWGQEIFPFFKTLMPKRVYQRLQKRDNVKISFIETERIIEKGKKNKDDVVLAMNEAPAAEPVVEEPTPEPEPVVEEEVVEEEKEDDDFPSYFKVKKKERVAEEVEEVVEEIIEEEPEIIEEPKEELFAQPERLEEVQEGKRGKRNKGNKEPKDKKVKVVTEYEIVINDFVYNQDGTQEPTEVTLKVKDWKMREDESASNNNEVFQLELDTNKGPVYVYLSGSMKITKIDFGPMAYLMRGL